MGIAAPTLVITPLLTPALSRKGRGSPLALATTSLLPLREKEG